jgi:hypothetical protein
VSDKQREAFELRVIVGSTRAALLKGDPTAIKERSDELLADLEARVIRDGADPQILAGIDTARRALWDDEPA